MYEFFKKNIKIPVQKGDRVFVYNTDNELIETYNTLHLGKAYFSMSNDAFYNTYGFNFVPGGIYYKASKRAVGKL